MKKKSSLAIFLWVTLLSLSLVSVAYSSPVKTNVLFTKVNAAPSKPTVDIIYPTQEDILEFGTHTINVLASDPNTGITAVQLKIDGPESTNGWVDITATLNEGYYTYDWAVGTEGDYSITARATNSFNRKADDNVGVTVSATPPAPDFTLDASPNALTIVVDSSDTSTITVTSLNRFSGTVYLTVSEPPADVVVTFTQNPVTPPADGSATSTMTVTVGDLAFPGTYTLTVTGTSDSLEHSIDVGLEIITALAFDYELSIEIDYIAGHHPTQAVLDYIEGYYMGNNPTGDLISVTFHIDDQIENIDDYAGISDTEFWEIEEVYNDNDNGYYSKWKWVLFGTTVEDEPDVVGYCYIKAIQVSRREADVLAGNYIFIADEAADDWAVDNGIEPYAAEAVVLMHEMGHSIGIGILKYHPLWGWHEVYDPDSDSVMSYLSTANAGLYLTWYYSDDYWATRNMEYYTI